jgi:hypothetical protein
MTRRGLYPGCLNDRRCERMALNGTKLSSRLYLGNFKIFANFAQGPERVCSLFDKRDNGFVEHVERTSLVAPDIRGYSGLRYRDGRV